MENSDEFKLIGNIKDQSFGLYKHTKLTPNM